MKMHARWWGMGAALLLLTTCRSEPAADEPGEPVVGGPGELPDQSPSIGGIDFDSTREVVGQVEDVDPQGLVVSEAGERRLRMRIDPETRVTVDGRPATTADLTEGSQVRARFHTPEGGAPTAVHIDATSPAGGE